MIADENETRVIEEIIARELDMPSLYMGGASPSSRRRARNILEILKSNGVEFELTEEWFRHDA